MEHYLNVGDPVVNMITGKEYKIIMIDREENIVIGENEYEKRAFGKDLAFAVSCLRKLVSVGGNKMDHKQSLEFAKKLGWEVTTQTVGYTDLALRMNIGEFEAKITLDARSFYVSQERVLEITYIAMNQMADTVKALMKNRCE